MGTGARSPSAGQPPRLHGALHVVRLGACRSLGYPAVHRPEQPAGGRGGAAAAQLTSTASATNAAFAYLFPRLDRPNLGVRGDNVVDRILVDARGRARRRDDRVGRLVRWHAPAVVLCAGALVPPAVLLRSGIGPATDLRQLGLPACAPDLPGVGARCAITDRARAGSGPLDVGLPGRGRARAASSRADLHRSGIARRNDLQIMPSYRGDWLALDGHAQPLVSTGRSG